MPSRPALCRDRFQRLEKIGEGSCGVVFKCRDRESGAVVAVKKVSFSYEGGSGDVFGVPCAPLREAALLRLVEGHPNIVSLRAAFVERERVFLAFEFVDRDLRRHLDEVGALPPMRAKLYVWQLLSAIAHCHARRVCHRDIKPANVLVHAEKDQLKLCDFSLARRVLHPAGKPQTRQVASLWYRSPEVLLGGEAHGMPLDVWSTGCIFGELVGHSMLFSGGSEIETLLLQFQLLGTPSEVSWPGVSKLKFWSNRLPKFPTPPGGPGPAIGAEDKPATGDLLKRLLSCDPAARPPAQDALAHAYFADLDTTWHPTPDARRPGPREGSPRFEGEGGSDECRDEAPRSPSRGRGRASGERVAGGDGKRRRTSRGR